MTWNVAGWGSVTKKGFSDYVKKENPDIICLQETKISPKEVAKNYLEGYHQFFSIGQQKGYSGVGFVLFYFIYLFLFYLFLYFIYLFYFCLFYFIYFCLFKFIFFYLFLFINLFFYFNLYLVYFIHYLLLF